MSDLNHEHLLGALGMSRNSQEWLRILDATKTERCITDEFDFGIYYTFVTLGFHVLLDNKLDAVAEIVFWNDDLRISRFAGTLPVGMSFDDRIEDIHKKLGMPMCSGKQRGLNFPAEPEEITDRDAAYDHFVVELSKQPISEVLWEQFEIGSYDVIIRFDLSNKGRIRNIAVRSLLQPVAWASS